LKARAIHEEAKRVTADVEQKSAEAAKSAQSTMAKS